MVSPELLRRFPFFSLLEPAHLKAVAMLADEIPCEQGMVLFEAGQQANTLYFLIEGDVDLHYVVADVHTPEVRQDFLVGHINPGELVGISALVEPYCYTAAARVSQPGRVLKIDAVGLRALCEVNPQIAGILMRHTAKAVMQRLHETRIQLAAARA